MSFSTSVHGKWILLGEHTVLRGGSALAFPVFGKHLNLSEIEGDGHVVSGAHGEEYRVLLPGVWSRALTLLNLTSQRESELQRVRFHLDADLPIGAGLGASAALAVAVGRYFVARGFLRDQELFGFCREIENLFHGESSGVDVAVALRGEGLEFQRGVDLNSVPSFVPAWEPNWYISFSGARGITSDCVNKVKALMSREPELGARLDEQMKIAVDEARAALLKPGSLGALAGAIERGARVFEAWGLSGGELGEHLAKLREAGAVAVKPTGSGGGGFALSLWDGPPPSSLLAPEGGAGLIRVFRQREKREA
ncbi:MAG TPA: hypothetical protein PLZ57_10355 [Pseudobdellovibrionaceae bacterium]|nr:hypothetical protein [Pseudobdellovibrionaceae bacterium]